MLLLRSLTLRSNGTLAHRHVVAPLFIEHPAVPAGKGPLTSTLAITGAITPMHRLKRIDEQVSGAMSPIAEIAASIEMPFICILSDEAEIARHTYPGVYRIDVRVNDSSATLAEWIAAFQAEWEHEDFKKSLTPNLKKKRIAGHSALPEWMPLYLGKSKNVARRVLEHINLPLEKTTFALKLKARPAMGSRVLRLHALEVQVKNYDVIVPALESALRNRFHPLIGKQ